MTRTTHQEAIATGQSWNNADTMKALHQAIAFALSRLDTEHGGPTVRLIATHAREVQGEIAVALGWQEPVGV